MINKKELDLIKEVLSDVDNTPNKKIEETMDLLRRDFELSKDAIKELSDHMLVVEGVYNELLSKYKKRLNV